MTNRTIPLGIADICQDGDSSNVLVIGEHATDVRTVLWRRCGDHECIEAYISSYSTPIECDESFASVAWHSLTDITPILVRAACTAIAYLPHEEAYCARSLSEMIKQVRDSLSLSLIKSPMDRRYTLVAVMETMHGFKGILDERRVHMSPTLPADTLYATRLTQRDLTLDKLKARLGCESIPRVIATGLRLGEVGKLSVFNDKDATTLLTQHALS